MKETTKILNEDSRQLSKFIKKESIDFVTFSPPYWNLRDYNFSGQIGFKQSYDEYMEDMKKVFLECFKVLKNGRFMAINIGTVVSNEGMKFIAGDFVKKSMEVGFVFRKDVIWHKPRGTTKWQRGATQFSQNPYPLKFNTNINHEYILIFQKGDLVDIDYTNISKFNRQFVRKMAYSTWNIIPINSPKNDEKHVAPFPEELPRRLIILFTFKNDIVLDPFAGCGTTNKVAKELGRKSIAIELSSEYCNLIKKKVMNVKFNSYNDSEIYDNSANYDIKKSKEKLDNAKKNYDRAKREHKKALSKLSKENGGSMHQIMLGGKCISQHRKKSIALKKLKNLKKGI